MWNWEIMTKYKNGNVGYTWLKYDLELNSNLVCKQCIYEIQKAVGRKAIFSSPLKREEQVELFSNPFYLLHEIAYVKKRKHWEHPDPQKYKRLFSCKQGSSFLYEAAGNDKLNLWRFHSLKCLAELGISILWKQHLDHMYFFNLWTPFS